MFSKIRRNNIACIWHEQIGIFASMHATLLLYTTEINHTGRLCSTAIQGATNAIKSKVVKNRTLGGGTQNPSCLGTHLATVNSPIVKLYANLLEVISIVPWGLFPGS